MTNAPADLLALRSGVHAVTGLSPDDLGIVGNVLHDCGFHIGRTNLIDRGCFHPSRGAGDPREDYSVRLARDRAGVTESASAFDLGSGWPAAAGGYAAWLRFNAAFLGELFARDARLNAVRAVNISTDGTTKHRYDREAGFAVQSTADTVTIHTHIEFYRDTEGGPVRAAAITEIVRLVAAAAGRPTQEDDMDLSAMGQIVPGASNAQVLRDIWTWLANMVDPNTPPTGRTDDRFHFPAALGGIRSDVAAIRSATGKPVDVAALAQLVVAGLTSVGATVTTDQVVAAFKDPAVQAVLTATAEAGANKAETE